MIKTMEHKKQIFTHQEKKKFLEILKNYSKEVENKHTHSSALKAKNLAWVKITHEFNSSPQTDFHRTPKQLRRLWMNMKQRQRETLARTLHPFPESIPRPIEDIISGSDVLQIAQALMNGVNSSVDSDIGIDTITNTDPVQSKTSICLSEESQNISNRETPVISTVKIEPMSPIIANPADTLEETPKPIQNSTLTPNYKAPITQQQDTLNGVTNSSLQSNLELQALEIQLLREKVRSQRHETKSREVHVAAMHNVEYQILKEKLREAKAKADLAELYLRRQHFSND